MLTEVYHPHARIRPRFHRETGDSRVVTPNERRVLSAIWNEPGLPRSSLNGRLDLTQQSIHRIISALEARGIIKLGELAPPAFKGKPSPKLTLNPRFACSVGISVNTDSAGVTVMDFAGGMETRAIDTYNLSMAEGLSRIDKVIGDLLAETGFGQNDIFGVGFGISGFLVEGTRYNAPEPLEEWSTLQLGPYLADHYQLPVWTENGANAAALCEMMFGLGRDCSNFAYLSFNYGFGGGLIVNGELLRGGFGNAGELSAMFRPEEKDDRPRLRSLLDMLQERGVNVSSIQDLADRFDISWPGVGRMAGSGLGPQQPGDQCCQRGRGPGSRDLWRTDPEAARRGADRPDRTLHDSSLRHLQKDARMLPSTIQGETAAMGAATLPLKDHVLLGPWAHHRAGYPSNSLPRHLRPGQDRKTITQPANRKGDHGNSFLFSTDWDIASIGILAERLGYSASPR